MEFLEFLKVIFIGIVQGITEWLPISSTGHMILVDEFIKLPMSDQFKEMFFVVIQLGSILAVLLLYFRKLNPFTKTKSGLEKKQTYTLWLKVLVASVPAAIVGLALDDIMDKINNWYVVALMLFIYGVLFIVIENRNKNRKARVNDLNEITYKDALIVGGFQMLALIPGTSRSGATIVGSIMFGLSRTVAAEFSFFMAIPVMFGASALKLLKFGLNYTAAEIMILVLGMVVAFVVSVFAIKFLMNFIKKNDFKPFGYYRIILAILVALYFIFF